MKAKSQLPIHIGVGNHPSSLLVIVDGFFS